MARAPQGGCTGAADLLPASDDADFDRTHAHPHTPSYPHSSDWGEDVYREGRVERGDDVEAAAAAEGVCCNESDGRSGLGRPGWRGEQDVGRGAEEDLPSTATQR